MSLINGSLEKNCCWFFFLLSFVYEFLFSIDHHFWFFGMARKKGKKMILTLMDKYLTSSLPKVLPQNLTSCFFWFYVRFDYECDFFFVTFFVLILGLLNLKLLTPKRGEERTIRKRKIKLEMVFLTFDDALQWWINWSCSVVFFSTIVFFENSLMSLQIEFFVVISC
jgi:hypothetical protein